MAKRCPACEAEKPLAEFAANASRADGRQAHCRPCYSAYQREYYRRRAAGDSEYRVRQQFLRRKRRERLRHDNRRRLWAYLRTHPCVDCGERDPVVLEFDHREASEKSFAIGDAIFWKPWDEVARELELCDVRCANCHRRRTARQRGFYSYLTCGT